MGAAPVNTQWRRILLLAVIAGVVCSVGFTPVALLIHRLAWDLWIFVGALLVCLLSLRTLRREPRQITILEGFGLAVSGLFGVSSVALFAFVGCGLAWLFGLLLRFTTGPPRDPFLLARGIVAIAGGFIAIGGAKSFGDTLSASLFPTSGVGNAALFPKLTWRKLLLGVSAVLVLAGILFVLAGVRVTWWFALVLELLLLIASAPLFTALEIPRLEVRKRAIQAVRSLLQAAGFRIIDRLQTGDAPLDTLISVFELVAQRGGNVIAVAFKTAENSETQKDTDLTWDECAAVPTGLWAIQRSADKITPRLDANLKRATALLVVAGRRADKALKDFAVRESVHIAELDPDTIEDVLNHKSSEERLRELAKQCLGLDTLPTESGPQELANDYSA